MAMVTFFNLMAVKILQRNIQINVDALSSDSVRVKLIFENFDLKIKILKDTLYNKLLSELDFD